VRTRKVFRTALSGGRTLDLARHGIAGHPQLLLLPVAVRVAVQVLVLQVVLVQKSLFQVLSVRSHGNKVLTQLLN